VIGEPEIYVKRLEMLPRRRLLISEAVMREGVDHLQVAELVVHPRFGNACKEQG